VAAICNEMQVCNASLYTWQVSRVAVLLNQETVTTYTVIQAAMACVYVPV